MIDLDSAALSLQVSEAIEAFDVVHHDYHIKREKYRKSGSKADQEEMNESRRIMFRKQSLCNRLNAKFRVVVALESYHEFKAFGPDTTIDKLLS